MRKLGCGRTWIGQACAALIVAILLWAVAPAPAGAGSWGYYRTLTVQLGKVPSTQSNFTVLISITDGTLAHTDSSGHMGKTNAGDLRFTDNSNTTAYDYEIESYNSSTGALVAWVKVPSLSDGTVIRMWYGNASASDGFNAAAVWDDNFKGVWHLKESGNGTAGEFVDSTSNANNGRGGGGTSSAVPTQTSSGKIGSANSFDGGDYVGVGYAASLAITGDYTIEAWVNVTSLVYNDWNYIVNHSGKQEFGPYSNAGRVEFKPRNNAGAYFSTAKNSAITTGQWYYIVGVRSGADLVLYVDGSSAASRSDFTGTLRETSGGITIGGKDTTQYLNGVIDEVRVSATGRAANWITTSYNNQSSPSTFYSDGGEVNASGGQDPVPELSTFMLVGMGMAGLGAYFWFNRRRMAAANAK